MHLGQVRLLKNEVEEETWEHYVLPLIDPDNVDKRRAEVGLGKLANYNGNWGIIWDIEKHKERTVKIESEKKLGRANKKQVLLITKY